MYNELDYFEKQEGILENWGNLALEVLGDGVKAEGLNYLRSEDGRFWTTFLDLTPFDEQQVIGHLNSKANDKTNENVLYRLTQPEACPNCDSNDISIEFDMDDSDYEMSHSYWVCRCGWEDARASVYLHRDQIAA